MAGGHEVQKSRYGLDMGGFWRGDKFRDITDINREKMGLPIFETQDCGICKDLYETAMLAVDAVQADPGPFQGAPYFARLSRFF